MFYFVVILLCYPLLRLVTGVKSVKLREKRKKFLIYQTAKIGDLVCTTHVFRAIKRKYPDSYITVVISEYTKPILRNNVRIDTIIMFNNRMKGLLYKVRFMLKLLAASYDVAIVLVPNPTFIFMSLFALIPDVVTIVPDNIGITHRAVSFFCKSARHQMGTLTMKTYLTALKLVGVDNGDLKKEVFFTKNDVEKALRFIAKSGAVSGKDRCVGFVVSSGNRMKSLELKDILYLSEGLIKNFNAKVILLGTSDDKEISARIIKTLQSPSIINACGLFSLSELPALVSLLNLVIGVDTAPIYIADALDIPVVVIAGPCDMGEQRPLGKNVAIIESNSSCAPCSHTYLAPYMCNRGDRICLKRLNNDQILAACGVILNKVNTFKRIGRIKKDELKNNIIRPFPPP
nr:glycosyltransferase family 9 protein [Desulfobacterales bacterium]